jgi:hypothetical protein
MTTTKRGALDRMARLFFPFASTTWNGSIGYALRELGNPSYRGSVGAGGSVSSTSSRK